jgi:hypothetical protein
MVLAFEETERFNVYLKPGALDIVESDETYGRDERLSRSRNRPIG